MEIERVMQGYYGGGGLRILEERGGLRAQFSRPETIDWGRDEDRESR
jgi:hypothetical protein